MSNNHYHWSAQAYIDEVENGSDQGLQEYQAREAKFLKDSIDNSKEKTFIDVGAGYGRAIPYIAPIADKVIAIEIDDDLVSTLRPVAGRYSNVEVIVESGDNLASIVDGSISRPVILSLQNTLGPWDGVRDKAVDAMRQVAEPRHGEIIISLFCRESLLDWGIPMYATVSTLLGNYDPERSDIDNGLFATDTGYTSHWFSKLEREAIKKKLGGKLVNEIKDHKFHIFHIAY